MNKILLIGEIVVDVSLKGENLDKDKLRFGGIMHAARALWALDIPFSVAYISPSYLDEQIKNYLLNLGCVEIYKIGEVTGAPYIFLIEEVKEIGDQGYEFLLRDEIKIDYNEETLNRLPNFEENFLISGNYDISKILNYLKGNLHIDLANNVRNLTDLNEISYKFTNIFISTSSKIFIQNFLDIKSFYSLFEEITTTLILKENRGGSRIVTSESDQVLNIPAQIRNIVHSVGVGDVYDIIFIYFSNLKKDTFIAGVYSSWIASEYAQTTYPDDFKLNVKRILKISENELIRIPGINLPWEIRKKVNIYVAAPDFSFVNKKPLENVIDSLKYHNFSPRRPVLENGEMGIDASKERRESLFTKDMELLNECQIMLAVILYDDPGTYIEMGLASNFHLPLIVYDPYKQATNCMLTELPLLISHDLDEIIAELFNQASKLDFNEK